MMPASALSTTLVILLVLIHSLASSSASVIAVNFEQPSNLSASVGDTASWNGIYNVYLHPSDSCDPTDAIVIYSRRADDGFPSYTFTEENVGVVTFAGSQCESGQIATFEIDAVAGMEPEAREGYNATVIVDTVEGYNATVIEQIDTENETVDRPEVFLSDGFVACAKAGVYPMYCSEEEAQMASPQGTAHYEGGDSWMPDLENEEVFHGDYVGDAEECACEGNAPSGDHNDQDSHDHDHDHDDGLKDEENLMKSKKDSAAAGRCPGRFVLFTYIVPAILFYCIST